MTVVHPLLSLAADVARAAYVQARASHSRAGLEEIVLMGADGTPSMRVDVLVEDAVIESLTAAGVNVLSEERGFVDSGSALTVVIDPVRGAGPGRGRRGRRPSRPTDRAGPRPDSPLERDRRGHP